MILACGIALMLLFLVPSMLTGSFHVGALTGIGISLLLILYGIFGRWVNKLICQFWAKAAGRILLIILAAAVLCILTEAIACAAKIGDGKQYPPERNSTCVVLGCIVYDSGPSIMLKDRLDAAIEYLNDNPESACIVCGGQGAREPAAEGDVMRDYLVEHGISPERIYVDNTSEDTYENLKNADGIIKENNLNPRCAIVTSDYHVYRAVSYAKSLGYEEPKAVAARTIWWMFPVSYVREMYGIMEQWMINEVY